MVVAVVAFAVRVLYAVVVDPEPLPISDATSYHLLANHLADGHGFVRPYDLAFFGEALPTAEFPPLFPLLLAAVAFLGGTGVVAQRVVACAVGTGTVVVAAMLGRRVGGDRVGLVAGAAAAVSPMLVQPDGVLMAETLFGLLAAAAVLLAYRALDRPTPRRWAALGAVVGLAALARSEGVLLVPLLVLPLAVMLREPRRFALAGAATGMAVLVLLPWLVRNWVEFDGPVLTNNAGTLIGGANCEPAYYGEQKGLWLIACNQRVDVDGLDEADASARYRAAGLRYAGDHLGRVPRVLAIRLLRTWGLFEPGQQVDYATLEGRTHAWETAGTWAWWGMAPLAAGGVVVLRRRRTPVWPLLSTIALASVTAVLAYGNQRFRMPAEPVIVVLAATGAVAVVGRARARLASS